SLRMLARVRDVLADARFTSRFICEQPTVETDIEALAQVTRQTRVWNRDGPPDVVVMADEAMWTLSDAQRIAAADAADLVNIKVVKAGGLLASMAIADYLVEHAPHIGLYIGGLLMTDLAATARLHLAYALPRLDYVTGCFPRRAYEINPATVPLLYREGTRTLVGPKGSGLGTGLSLATLRPYVQRAVP
ncbi:MAG: enolase C-terminal domain-like protein, partial [Armatimonadota bacterium]